MTSTRRKFYVYRLLEGSGGDLYTILEGSSAHSDQRSPGHATRELAQRWVTGRPGSYLIREFTGYGQPPEFISLKAEAEAAGAAPPADPARDKLNFARGYN